MSRCEKAAAFKEIRGGGLYVYIGVWLCVFLQLEDLCFHISVGTKIAITSAFQMGLMIRPTNLYFSMWATWAALA